ncbi:FAD-dependent monooxygenase [Subtercola frigoramans]|uniref:2,4-dichlorophenol 6-monooxygenase n=1 Tax=Subtercola frigoramans TaxID=120298 RepID=A0ABS2L981_9MICO|nr:FAD-dependent monooxygenase [Subtercola frigoramans]MBM7473632.1 2,4-dichlorophenol 6-monooxygenase [Subtercola frigoramans]
MQQIDVPVLIVGAGPAGLTTALSLRQYGVECLLVEKYGGTAHTPRAHIVNQRTVEIMRHLGLEEGLREVATPSELMRNNLWITTLADPEVARLEAWGTGIERSGDYAAASPSQMVNCPQTVFEPLLLDALLETGCDVRMRHELVSFEQDDTGVTSTVIDRDTGESLLVRSQFVVGADGAAGRVLPLAGLVVEGKTAIANAFNIWFRADLAPYLAHRPGVLAWNLAPGPLPTGRLGTLICHRPFTEFVLVINYDPENEDPTSFDDDELKRRIRAVIGEDGVDIEILGTSPWVVNALVAPHYSAGRVFCMGDAVHRHPPANGLGLNMSVADAFNLAWKLALVVKDQAGPELLESYSTERQPIGAAGVARALASRGEFAAVADALGYEPGQSTEEGRRLLDELSTPGAAGEHRRDLLRAAVRRTNHQFNAHGIELGYRYSVGALVDDVPEEPHPDYDTVLYYRPTTRPGARLPHARVGLGTSELSTLDLVDGARFALITGLGGEGWRAAAAAVSAATGVGIDVHVIGEPGGLQDLYGEWADRREIADTGCVLVRPDRHVGWRAGNFADDAADVLTRALNDVLCMAVTEPVPAGR